MLVDEMPIASFRTPPAPDARQAGSRAAVAAGASCAASARSAPDAAGAAHPVHGGSQVFNVRLAISAERHADAGVLLRRMYAWRGYAVAAGTSNGENKVTLYAETGGELVGTVSLCLERKGVLPADGHFADCLDILRRQGARLCEPSRLAIDKGMSKRVFAALMHISHLYASRLHGCTDYVIEVNPRHVAFYRDMLGFAEFGAERQCDRVGAPAVLLRLPIGYMSAQIAKWGGSTDPQPQPQGRQQQLQLQLHGERSFYPYFFPVRDEPDITARLAALCATGEQTGERV